MQYIQAARALSAAPADAFRHIPLRWDPSSSLHGAARGAILVGDPVVPRSFEPYPSWGRMLSVSAAEYAQKEPHLVLFPGIAISLAVFGSNLLGDALRDTLDPRLRGS
jgi:ABC-type dipeptide/oligopeptide/nickel transport system permease component